ncbi:MAG: bifunctional nuclease family protein [Armatimonas sp.]
MTSVIFWEAGDPGDGRPEDENAEPRALHEKEVQVLGLWRPVDDSDPDGPITEAVVLLRDNQGRRLPIEIGPFETMAIHYALQGTPTERPLTHDLFKNVMERLGAQVERVIIDDVWDKTYYAKVELAAKTEKDPPVLIDSRPSDAIALALRFSAPIYVAEEVLKTSAQSVSDQDDD